MKHIQTETTFTTPTSNGCIFLRGLKTKCIIGIFDWERKKKQTIIVDFKFPSDISKAAKSDRIEDTEDYKSISKTVLKLISQSSYFLIETLAEKIAQSILSRVQAEWVQITVSKPGAVRFSENVGIEITRYRQQVLPDKNKFKTIYLSIGSNIRRRESIRRTLVLLEEFFGSVIRSSIFESTAIGNKKSPNFWNLVVKVQTNLSPKRLKQQLIKIETEVGRVKGVDKYEPRIIDIDILFYDTKIIKQAALKIPHPDAERAHYVLIPMLQLNPDFVHPGTQITILEMLGASLDQKNRFTKVDW